MLALFFKIDTIAFGGGMVVIAIMEQEFVQKRQQLPAEEFLHAVGLAEILGSFAPNAAFFLGYRRYGLVGALVCVAAFYNDRHLSLIFILTLDNSQQITPQFFRNTI